MDTTATPFSITYVKANRRKKEAGDTVHLPACLQTGTQPKGEHQGKRPTALLPGTHSWAKKPNHYANATRNLILLPSKQIRKVHIWLITEFNDMKVII